MELIEEKNGKLFAPFAYLETVPDLSLLHDMHVIDLHCANITNIEIDNFPNLERLRFSNSGIKSCKITNCPNLQVIEASGSKLENAEFINLPNLRALCLSYTELPEVSGDFPSLEVLNLHFCAINNQTFENLNAPNLLALDVSGTYIDNPSQFIFKYSKLERLKIIDYQDRCIKPSTIIELNLNELSRHSSLRRIFCGFCKVTCDEIAQQTKIDTIVLEYPTWNEGSNQKNLIENQNICVLIINANKYNYNVYEYNKYPNFDQQDFPSWVEPTRLLYGPWGIPKNDRIDQSSRPVNLKTPLISIKFDHTKTLNYMMGSVFGAALGDTLGCTTEFHNTNYARFALDCPLDITWSQMLQNDMNSIFRRGSPTDDSEQMVLLMRAIGSCDGSQEKALLNFAKNMRIWMQEGIIEHKQEFCFDCGASTRAAVSHPNYLKNPIGAAKEIWDPDLCGNGSVMRIAPIGCYYFWDDEKVIDNAIKFGQCTHYDVRCVVCTIVISLLIAKSIQKNVGFYTKEINVDEIIDLAIQRSGKYAQRYLDVFDQYLRATNFEALDLSGRRTGFVMRATGAAVLCFRRGYDYSTAINEIIRWAGDADSNAAVVGAVIGATVGLNGIPKEILKRMFDCNWVWKEFVGICVEMGITIPPSIFDSWCYE
ncbi:hypothetical protein TRFO_11597 [Tritrichomonas foetus]|uniref:ADP-ribosylhydrolase ARH3 n=1 Tax=Tritrichomonas foetus TaxID=1144522 RepID=A0A1J4J7Z6_9EUKA|nr:hypothetical protein TRFO_11597 [Tritrichomonas foetus]|eukprot:OHS93787.1 hypothetical protein TRFO_11597 [Tritrichomonas foetus]